MRLVVVGVVCARGRVGFVTRWPRFAARPPVFRCLSRVGGVGALGGRALLLFC